MKIALITDTHFGARNDHEHFNTYFHKFYEDIFFPYLKEHNIKTCIHLGDVMDRRKFISFKIAKDFREKFCETFVTNGIDVHMIVGNHDTYYKNTNDVNSLDELIGKRYPSIKIYKEATTVEFDGFPIFLIPWINATNYSKTIDAMNETRATQAMGHLEIKGFEMNHNMRSETGMDKSVFSKFEAVFSGHFHKKSDDGHIFYLGTPYQIYWNDDKCPKGFHIFDTETRSMERIINPYTIYKKIYYDDTTGIPSKDIESIKDKFIKLVVVNKNDLYNFDRYVDWLLTVPLLLIELILVMKLTKSETVSKSFNLGLAAAIMVILGYPGEISMEAGTRWTYWVLAMIPFIYIVYQLYVGLGEAISKQPDNVKGLVATARNVTVLSWCFYPVVFIFPMIGIEGSNAYTAIQVGYTVADIVSKAAFGVLIFMIAKGKSDAEA